jgi:tetratricopeptide (TPR) repeat protein
VRSPDDPFTWNNRGLCRARQGDLAGACEDYDRALALRPGYLIALVNRADAARRLEDDAAAIAFADRALALDPGRAEALLIIAKALMHRGAAADLDRAEVVLEQYLERRPDAGRQWYDWGACAENRRDLRAARARYGRALELLPADDPIAAWARDRLAGLGD